MAAFVVTISRPVATYAHEVEVTSKDMATPLVMAFEQTEATSSRHPKFLKTR